MSRAVTVIVASSFVVTTLAFTNNVVSFCSAILYVQAGWFDTAAWMEKVVGETPITGQRCSVFSGFIQFIAHQRIDIIGRAKSVEATFKVSNDVLDPVHVRAKFFLL